MTCPWTDRDGAYVLGALPAAERLEFEEHLGGCSECSASVSRLAGLPGLLSRVDASVLADLPVQEPVPARLLPRLVEAAQRARRRRLRIFAASAAAAAAVLVAALTLGLPRLLEDDGRAPTTPSARGPAQGDAERPASSPGGEPMTPVGDATVHAELAFESVAWGTRLDLACTYTPGNGTAGTWTEGRQEVTYTMVVRTRDGHTEQVGTWRSPEGRTMRLSAATAANRADIAAVEVRTSDGRPVLELTG